MDRNAFLKNLALQLYGAAVGSAVTIYLVRKHYDKKYSDLAEEQIESVKHSYKLLYKEGPYSDPKKASEEKQRIVRELDSYEGLLNEEGYFDLPEGDPGTATAEDLQLFDQNGERLDKLTEPLKPAREDDLETRDLTMIHLITVDEYMETNLEFDKLTVRYYQGDNTMVDDNDEPFPTSDQVIGSAFVGNFGWNSGSPDVVYVRNPMKQMDFEILSDSQSYSEAVLGIPDYPAPGSPKQKSDG